MEIATYFLDETCYSKTYNVLTTLYIACFYLSMYYYICKSLLIHIFVLFYQYRNLFESSYCTCKLVYFYHSLMHLLSRREQGWCSGESTLEPVWPGFIPAQCHIWFSLLLVLALL